MCRLLSFMNVIWQFQPLFIATQIFRQILDVISAKEVELKSTVFWSFLNIIWSDIAEIAPELE